MIAALEAIESSEEVVVLSGDHPLLGADTIAALLETHRSEDAKATVMTVELDDPGQYGRIVRDSDGGVERIVETKHPESVPPEILATKEINTGTYCFHGPTFAAAPRPDHQRQRGRRVLPRRRPSAHARGRPPDRRPRRHRPQREPRREHPRRPRARRDRGAPPHQRGAHARRRRPSPTPHRPGSTPASRSARTPTIEPGTALRGETTIGDGATIGPHTTILSPTVGDNSHRPSLPPRLSHGRRQLHRRPLHLSAARREARRRLEGRHLRRDQELGDRRRERRSRTSPTSATRTSARAQTSAPARSPRTTTARTSTARRSGKVRESRSTTRSSRRSRLAMALTLAPVP